MKKPTYHVTQNDSGWGIKRSGNPTPLSTYKTQSEAIAAGKIFAQFEHTELRIHGRDGKIRDSDSYGNDPFPPRDRKH